MTQPVRPEDMRASDAERELVQQWLHRAHADGSLDLAEFDARVVRTWQAKTRGELAVLTADLPTVPAVLTSPPTSSAHPGHPGPSVHSASHTSLAVPASKKVNALKVLTTVWLSISAVNFALWMLASLLGGDWVHPWFLWVAVPPGTVLGVVWVATRQPHR